MTIFGFSINYLHILKITPWGIDIFKEWHLFRGKICSIKRATNTTFLDSDAMSGQSCLNITTRLLPYRAIDGTAT